MQTIVEKERLKTKALVEEAKREAQREAAEREREMEERTDVGGGEEPERQH